MTKATEIATLKGFTERLPHDSYLRPWLESILPEVEADIRNDFPVSPSPQAGRKPSGSSPPARSRLRD